MRRRLAWTAVILASTFVCAFLFSPLLARVDAARVARDQEPIFCWSHWLALLPLPFVGGFDRMLLDGGTRFYDGFGYELTRKHSIAPLQYAEGEKVQFDSGVVVRFYIPGYDRFSWETSYREGRRD
jgi:hypothetical protein